jgi:hypothetical protein
MGRSYSAPMVVPDSEGSSVCNILRTMDPDDEFATPQWLTWSYSSGDEDPYLYWCPYLTDRVWEGVQSRAYAMVLAWRVGHEDGIDAAVLRIRGAVGT